jgi:hypothetical protein
LAICSLTNKIQLSSFIIREGPPATTRQAQEERTGRNRTTLELCSTTGRRFVFVTEICSQVRACPRSSLPSMFPARGRRQLQKYNPPWWRATCPTLRGRPTANYLIPKEIFVAIRVQYKAIAPLWRTLLASFYAIFFVVWRRPRGADVQRGRTTNSFVLGPAVINTHTHKYNKHTQASARRLS